MCLRTGFSPVNAIVLTGKTWYPELGAGICGWTRVMQALRAGNHCLPGGLEFRELGKASDMKKAVFVLATAATIGITALVTPSPAQAWRGGWGGWRAGPTGGLIAGTVIGGIVAGVPARGPGYCYYTVDYYGPWCYMGYQYGR